jgi:hypothetical protein
MNDRSNNITIAVMANDIINVKQHLKSIDQKISSTYVTKQEIARLKDQIKLLNSFMYGTVTITLLGVVYAILNVIGLGKH